MAICVHWLTFKVEAAVLMRLLVSHPVEKEPLELAWSMNCPHPGPALWFQLLREAGRSQYSIVALS